MEINTQKIQKFVHFMFISETLSHLVTQSFWAATVLLPLHAVDGKPLWEPSSGNGSAQMQKTQTYILYYLASCQFQTPDNKKMQP